MNGAAGDRYVLDAFALLAFLGDEPGSEDVQEILRSAETDRVEAWLCIINFGEALYILEREESLEAAQKAVAITEQLPIQVIEADRSLTFTAAHVKAHHSLSYADAFAVALALEVGGAVVTGDREFEGLRSLVPVRWLKGSER